MSFLSNLFRCLCLCVVIERGTWSPNEKKKISKRNRDIVKKHLYTQQSSKTGTTDPSRPAWLKEWTISKGWVHNKSHMLALGHQSSLKMEDNLSETSSISSQNIDELVSLESNIDQKIISKQLIKNIKSVDTESEDSADCSSEDDETVRISSLVNRRRPVSVFEQVSENYRNNFPETSKTNYLGTFELPQIYKEQLLLRQKKETNILQEIWKHMKPKSHKTSRYDCRFTENQIFNNNDIFNSLRSISSDKFDTNKSNKKTNLAKNIALYNDLNSRRNLHEETIYECSEENSNQTSLNNIYHNPIYSQSTNQVISVYDRRMEQYQRHLKHFHDNNDLAKLKSDKYVIRHIRVRIMLSLRVGKVQKAKNYRPKKRNFFGGKKRRRKVTQENDNVHFRVAKIHDEQRRIGNGKSSIKIQNMRYVF